MDYAIPGMDMQAAEALLGNSAPQNNYAVPGIDMETAEQLLGGNVPRRTIEPNGFFNSAPQIGGNRPDFGLVKRLAGAVGEGGRRILNIPNQLGLPNAAPIGNENTVYDALGYKPNTLDKIGAGLVEYSPFGAGGAKIASMGINALKNPIKHALASNAIGGAAAGATLNPENRLQSAGMGAGIGALATGTGAVGQKVISKGAEWFGKNAIPSLLEKVNKSIKGAPIPENHTANLQNRYIQDNLKNKALFQETDALAKDLDAQLATNFPIAAKQFNSSRLQNFLTNFVNKTEKLEGNIKAPHQESLGFIKYLQDEKLIPQSFEGAVAMRKNLNQSLSDYMRKNNMSSTGHNVKELIKNIKKELTDTVKDNANLVKKDSFNAFEKTWENANKSNVKMQDYYKVPQGEGALKVTRQRREALESGNINENVIGKYLPKQKDQSINGYKQLEKIIGGKEPAKEALRAFYFRDFLNNPTSSQTPEKIFSKLSPQQREYIFGGTKEKEALDALNKAALSFGMPEKENMIMKGIHHIGAFGIPALLGTVGAQKSGLPWDEAVLAGVGTGLAYKGAKKGVGNLTTPNAVKKAVQRAEKPIKNPGKALNPLLQSEYMDLYLNKGVREKK